MARISKNTATFLIILGCVIVVHATKFLIHRFRGDITQTAGAKTTGNKDAPIKITEFIDFQCPACAGGSAYLKKTVEQYPEAIWLEVKHYPLQMHRHGWLSSQYVECAARQDKFWPFQNLVLARQRNWGRLLDAGPAFEQIAKESRVDLKDLRKCLEDESLDEDIQKDKDEGKAIGLKSTPTYVVNGEMIVGSKSLQNKVAELLKDNGY